jgi:hypothetical protein
VPPFRAELLGTQRNAEARLDVLTWMGGVVITLALTILIKQFMA